MTIIWSTVPEMWRTTDRTFVILDHFLPFYPPPPFNNPKKWKFWKSEKNPGDAIILHKCIKNHDHMIHCSWNTTHDRCNFYFSFSAIFCPFDFFFLMKKRKKRLEILSFYTCVPQKLWLHNVQFLRYSAWWMDWQTERLTDGKSDI